METYYQLVYIVVSSLLVKASKARPVPFISTPPQSNKRGADRHNSVQYFSYLPIDFNRTQRFQLTSVVDSLESLGIMGGVMAGVMGAEQSRDCYALQQITTTVNRHQTTGNIDYLTVSFVLRPIVDRSMTRTADRLVSDEQRWTKWTTSNTVETTTASSRESYHSIVACSKTMTTASSSNSNSKNAPTTSVSPALGFEAMFVERRTFYSRTNLTKSLYNSLLVNQTNDGYSNSSWATASRSSSRKGDHLVALSTHLGLL